MGGDVESADADRPGHPSDGQQPDVALAGRLSEMARALQAETGLDATLHAIVHAAVDNIAGAHHAGITVVKGGGQITTPASTDDLVERIDRAQYEANQGPCLSAIRDHITVRSDDLRVEERWPDFSHRAAHLGVRSMLAFQLFVRNRDLGALNLYSREPNAFGDADEHFGLVFASHAAIAMVGAQDVHHLHSALSNRDLIGQAKGILMERYKVSAQQAFELLVRASQDANQKLHVVALRVTAAEQTSGRTAGRD